MANAGFAARFPPGSCPPHPTITANLEVGLLEDSCQLCSRAALLCQLCQVPKDFLHQLQVVITNGLQLCLLQPLVGLGHVEAVQVRPATHESQDGKQHSSSGSKAPDPDLDITCNVTLGPTSAIQDTHTQAHTITFRYSVFFSPAMTIKLGSGSARLQFQH